MQVRRLNLMLAGDDPAKFAERMERARQLQRESEAKLRQSIRARKSSAHTSQLPSDQQLQQVRGLYVLLSTEY